MSLCHRHWGSLHRDVLHWTVLSALLLFFSPINSFAAGFALIENSASGMGSAFASGGAAAEDASSLYFNPASMALLSKRQLSVAGHYIHPKASFSNGNSTTATGAPLQGGNGDGGVDALVPNLYYTMAYSDKLNFGLAINVPFGLSTKYDDTWKGRYHAVDSEVSTVNINPSLSYRLTPHWLIGGGLNAQYVDVKLSSAVDFYGVCTSIMPASVCASQGLQSQQSDGFATVTGNDWAYGLNLGAIYIPDEATRIALAYRPGIVHDVDGTVDFTVPANASFLTSSGAFQDGAAHARLYLPAVASLSFFHQSTQKLSIMADYTWTEWSRFKELRVVYANPAQPNSVTNENWNNNWRVAVGAKYQLRNNLALRGGLAYDSTPVPDAQHRTPRVPDYDRKWISFGLNDVLANNMSVDFGYSHLFVSNTPINNTLESDAVNTRATINGTYDNSVDIASAQLNWNF